MLFLKETTEKVTHSRVCLITCLQEAYEALDDNTIPEMQRSNLAGVLLQLKALGINNVLRFPFLSPPPAQSMAKALELLYALEAIDEQSALCDPLGAPPFASPSFLLLLPSPLFTFFSRPSVCLLSPSLRSLSSLPNLSSCLPFSVGIQMAEFPLDPMQARMLLSSGAFGCSQEILSIAAMLQVQHVFVSVSNKKKSAERHRYTSFCSSVYRFSLALQQHTQQTRRRRRKLTAFVCWCLL